MKEKRTISTPCIVRAQDADHSEFGGISEGDSGELRECRIIDSVRKLMALGPSVNGSERLEMCQPVVEAICEYARLDSSEIDGAETVAGVVEATIKVINDQLSGIDIETEMLRLRKRALKRRMRILEKLAASLKSDNNPMGA
ncbi:MAG: hypothetical protein ACYC64_10990 [Armatimonadota bacterium]